MAKFSIIWSPDGLMTQTLTFMGKEFQVRIMQPLGGISRALDDSFEEQVAAIFRCPKKLLYSIRAAFDNSDADTALAVHELTEAEKKAHMAASPATVMTDFERGYNRALADINQSKDVVAEAWNPSECPRCGRDFAEFEPCDDGYYKRAMSLERCPYCGQKLRWVGGGGKNG